MVKSNQIVPSKMPLISFLPSVQQPLPPSCSKPKPKPKTNPKPNYTGAFNQSKTGNPNEFLGVRDDLTPKKMLKFAREFKNAGATILGGCCETRPSHIKAFAQLK